MNKPSKSTNKASNKHKFTHKWISCYKIKERNSKHSYNNLLNWDNFDENMTKLAMMSADWEPLGLSMWCVNRSVDTKRPI